MKQQHGGRPATAGTVLTAEITAAAGTIGTSWMSTIVGPQDLDSRKVGNSAVEKTAILSRDTATALGGHNWNIRNSSGDSSNITDADSRRETRNSRDARNRSSKNS